MRFEKRTLGRTGFSVAPLGLASGYGTDVAMVEEAIEHGVNYLYWGAWRSKRMAEGIKEVTKKNHEDLVIVVQKGLRESRPANKYVSQLVIPRKKNRGMTGFHYNTA